jgi:hypothetical protein
MLLPQISILFCNNLFVLRCMRLILDYCNKWCVMLNHYDLGLLCFGLKSLMISWTTGVIWAQVWEFDHFGDCFWTCALMIWMVPWQSVPALSEITLLPGQSGLLNHLPLDSHLWLPSEAHFILARARPELSYSNLRSSTRAWPAKREACIQYEQERL